MKDIIAKAQRLDAEFIATSQAFAEELQQLDPRLAVRWVLLFNRVTRAVSQAAQITTDQSWILAMRQVGIDSEQILKVWNAKDQARRDWRDANPLGSI